MSALWVRHWDAASDHEYFVNSETGESRWEPPEDLGVAAAALSAAPEAPTEAAPGRGAPIEALFDDDEADGFDLPTSRSSAAVALFRSATMDEPEDDSSASRRASLLAGAEPAAAAVDLAEGHGNEGGGSEGDPFEELDAVEAAHGTGQGAGAPDEAAAAAARHLLPGFFAGFETPAQRRAVMDADRKQEATLRGIRDAFVTEPSEASAIRYAAAGAGKGCGQLQRLLSRSFPARFG